MIDHGKTCYLNRIKLQITRDSTENILMMASYKNLRGSCEKKKTQGLTFLFLKPFLKLTFGKKESKYA